MTQVCRPMQVNEMSMGMGHEGHTCEISNKPKIYLFFHWKVWLETLLEPEKMSGQIFTNSSSILVQLLHQSLPVNQAINLSSPKCRIGNAGWKQYVQLNLFGCVYNWKCQVETICADDKTAVSPSVLIQKTCFWAHFDQNIRLDLSEDTM